MNKSLSQSIALLSLFSLNPFFCRDGHCKQPVVMAKSENSGSISTSGTLTANKSERAFQFRPGSNFPNCALNVDPRTYHQSPWLEEIMLKMDEAWLQSSNLRGDSTIACEFEINRTGQIENLCAGTITGKKSSPETQSAAFEIIKKLGPFKPLPNAFSNKNKVKLIVVFKQFPKYGLTQKLIPFG